MSTKSRQEVTAINDKIRARGICRRIRRQVKESTLKLVGLSFTAHGDLVSPGVLRLLGHKVRDLRVDVAWRNGVDSGELDPLDSETATYPA